ncbi:MAG: ferritin family protein [Desulfobacterales bacterium]
MQFENLEQILNFAIEKEQSAREFYEDAAREESMSGVKEMLLEFADEERKHAQMLSELKNKGAVKGISSYKFKWIPDMKRSNYLHDLEFTPGMPYNELLMMAIKNEEKALKLYNELLAQADTQPTHDLFKVLCQEEAKHKLKFETMYDDYMAEMGD